MNNIARGVKLESPCRIDIMGKESFDRFLSQIDELSKQKKITIELPLFSARDRGVYRVVFLDKWMMEYSGFDNRTIQTLQM